MNRQQVAVLVVELADVGVRQARELADRAIGGHLRSRLPLLVPNLKRRLDVNSSQPRRLNPGRLRRIPGTDRRVVS